MKLAGRKKLVAGWIAAGLACLGLSGSAAAQTSVRYGYDQLGRLTTALYDNGLCIVYTYDANGNRTSQVGTASGTPQTPTWGVGSWGCFPWTP